MNKSAEIHLANLPFLFCAAISLFTAISSYSSDRVAIVVGIDRYSGDSRFPSLANTVSDAQLVSGSLKNADFDVTLLKNPTSEELLEAAGKVGNSTDLVFYFAGHGIQIDERNFLICSNSKLDSDGKNLQAGVEISNLLDRLEPRNSDHVIVFLDCCRSIPAFAPNVPSRLKAGLTGEQYPSALICYASSPGSVASDGTGNNGPFATALARYISGNAELNQLIKNVTNEVRIKTESIQVPYVAGSLPGDFFFRKSDTNVVAQYREKLKELDTGTIQSIVTAMDLLKKLSKSADEPTRSLLIGDFVKFRESYLGLPGDTNENVIVSALDNEPLMNRAGIWIREKEGTPFLVARPMWIEGNLARIIPIEWIEYFESENREANNPSIEDASIMIEYSELASRLIEKEEFLIKNFTFPARDLVEASIDGALQTFLFGIDGSPVTIHGSNMIKPDLLKAVDHYIEQGDPTWRGFELATSFRKLLNESGGTVNSEVKNFISQKGIVPTSVPSLPAEPSLQTEKRPFRPIFKLFRKESTPH